jgi:hypothetical protein
VIESRVCPRSFAEMAPDGATRESELLAGREAGLARGYADAAKGEPWMPCIPITWAVTPDGQLARRPSCAFSEGHELGYVEARPNPHCDEPRH